MVHSSIPLRRCAKCQTIKPIYEFQAVPYMASGFEVTCKACAELDHRKYQLRTTKAKGVDMADVNGRMRALVNDLVRESRREGMRVAEIRYESETWNDERDNVFITFVDSKDKFHVECIKGV